jgi:hypothetical protein
MPRGGDRGGRKPTLPPEQRKKAKQLMLSPDVIAKLAEISDREGWSESYLAETIIRIGLLMPADYSFEDLVLLVTGVFE